MKTPIFYQTSPYIVVQQNGRNHNIYSVMDDTEVPISIQEIKLLSRFKDPQVLTRVQPEFERQIVYRAIENGWLLRTDEIWHQTNMTYLAIAVNSHCNWRCEYCPVHDQPAAPSYMNRDDFERILENVSRNKSLRYVALNVFNEPLLDKYFADRIRLLHSYGLRLMLNTNASHLEESVLRLLSEYQIVEKLLINFPSPEQKEFYRMTGYRHLDKVMKNIQTAINLNFPCEIAVNGTHEDRIKAYPVIQRLWGENQNVIITDYSSVDRAGNLQNQYLLNIYNKKLYGCRQIIRWLHVGIHGEVFTCSMDFHKENIYGNALEEDIADIINGHKAISLRRKIFGADQADTQFICRRCLDMKSAKINLGSTMIIRPNLI